MKSFTIAKFFCIIEEESCKSNEFSCKTENNKNSFLKPSLSTGQKIRSNVALKN